MKAGTRVSILGGSYKGHTGIVRRVAYTGAFLVDVDATQRCTECGGDKPAAAVIVARFLVDAQQALRLEEAS